MELTFKEACFDLTEGKTKWRVWFYANRDVRVLKDGNVIKELHKQLIQGTENVDTALFYITQIKFYEKTT